VELTKRIESAYNKKRALALIYYAGFLNSVTYMNNTNDSFSQGVNFTLDTAKNLVDSVERFPVDFEMAWQWLAFSRKDVAKRSFEKCEFVETLDFSSLRQKVEREIGATSKEIIKMTVDCFKCWAMMSNTAKGKEVRQYFLECEKIAKEKSKPMTSLESLLATVQQLVEFEKKQKELESAIIEVKQEQSVLKLEVEANSAELTRFTDGHSDWYSALGYARLKGLPSNLITLSNVQYWGRKATALCKIHGIKPEKLKDAHYGKIGCYPQWILDQVFTEV